MYCIFPNPDNAWGCKPEECVGVVDQDFSNDVWYHKVLPLVQSIWGEDVVVYQTMDVWKYNNIQKYIPTPAFRKLKKSNK